MGAGEGISQGKPSKQQPQQQDQQQSANSFSEWAAAFQAYYGSGAQPPHGAGYYPSATSAPQPHHPYIWGSQMMPYGAPPPPYPAMYPTGAMYHPSIPPGTPHPYGQFSTAAIPTSTGTDTPTARPKVPAGSNGEAKTAEGNGSSLPSGTALKGCKSNLSLVPPGSAGDTAKTGHNSGDGLSNSGDSGGSDDTSDSEEELGQNAYGRRMYDQNGTEVTGHGGARSGSMVPAGNGEPATALGVGMDYWPHSTASSTAVGITSTKSTAAAKRGVTTGAVVPIPPPPPPLPPPATSSMTSLVPATPPEGLQELWYQQDEREVKRQRRKQSNRESARRSRLRKQAECEELGARVDTLTSENMTLRNELARVHDECKKLAADNAALKDELCYLREDRSCAENGKGERIQQQQATRANASGELWKRSLHLRKEVTNLPDSANGGAVGSSGDRVTDASNGGRGMSVDGAAVAASSPRGLERERDRERERERERGGGSNRRRSRSPSRNGLSHHHNGNGSGSRRMNSQGKGSGGGKTYDEEGEVGGGGGGGGGGYVDQGRKSPRGGPALGLGFGTGADTGAAGISALDTL